MSIASHAAEPAGTIALQRCLHDGAAYHLAAPSPGVTTLTIHDIFEDSTTISLDQGDVRRLIDDLELVAELRLTLGRALGPAGAIQIIFDYLRQLERTEPAEVAVILSSIADRVQHWVPAPRQPGAAQ